jgi:hypothetical protein
MSARVASWLRTLSSVALTALIIAHVLIFWRGGWPDETALRRIDWLGWTNMGLVGALILSLFLTPTGIRTIRFKGGPVEASINDDDGGGGEPGPRSEPTQPSQ